MVAFRDYTSAWLALVQGRVDALTGSLQILQGFMRDNPNFKIVGELFSVEPFGIGVRQGDSELRDEVNFVLQDLWTERRIRRALPQMVRRRPHRPDRNLAVNGGNRVGGACRTSLTGRRSGATAIS